MDPRPALPGTTAQKDEERQAREEPTPLHETAWLPAIEEELARSEYFWSATPDGALSVPNRAQELRSRISEEGIEVFPRATSESGEGAPWKLELETVGFGYEGDVRPIGASRLTRIEHRIERHSSSLTEWYVNDERGIEHGWTIPAPPPGPVGKALRIELSAKGLDATLAEDGLSARFVDERGELRLRYQGLVAKDASARELASRMIVTSAGLAVLVEDEGALYPITVDPVLGGPVWTAESDQAHAFFGVSVSGAGDVNGDGFDDVLVGAYLYDNGQQNEGRSYLYLGSAGGPSLAPDWTAESNQAEAEFGVSVSGAGDVNGDGFDDVVVGAMLFDNGEIDEGRSFLYLGSPGGLSLAPDWTAESNQASALFGASVSGAGDVNGDGFDDLVVGSHTFHNGQTDEGRAFLYLGSAVGPSLAPDWTAESDQVEAQFGLSVSGVGDVNGDGFDDVVVGAFLFDNGQTNEGRSFLYLGSAGGLSLAASWTAESDQADAWFGRRVSGAGDVNGDGFDDVVVGAYVFDNGQTNEGRSFLYLGSAGGLSLAPDWTAESDQPFAFFGHGVAGAGDVNGDGFDDVVVGAPDLDDDKTDEGRSFLYLGSAGGLSLTPDWTAEGDRTNAEFGTSVSGAGDVNGDGLDDVIVGAEAFHHGETEEGRAFLYVGQQFVDCNGNGVNDADDIVSGTSDDCNSNGIPDECDVRSGTSIDANGNGVPDECEIGTKYCAASANSTGSPADILATGSASSSTGDLRLISAPVPDQTGIFFHGSNQSQIPFGNGFLCTTDGIVRGELVMGASNVATYTYDNSDAKHDLSAFAGTTRNFQHWFRDPMGGGALFNTSNAISIAILP
jgi:hypothetical protein